MPRQNFQKIGNNYAVSKISNYIDELFKTFSSIIKGIPEGINWGNDNENINWIEVSQNIKELKDVDKIYENYVTPDERKFYNLLQTVIARIKDTFNTTNLKDDTLLNTHKIISEDNIQKIDQLRNIEIKKSLFSRDVTVVEQALNALEEAYNNIDRFWNYGKNLLIRNDTPQNISFDRENKIINITNEQQDINNFSTKLYVCRTDLRGLDNFQLDFNIKGSKDFSTFSVLAYEDEDSNNDVASTINIAKIGIGNNLMSTGLFKKIANTPINQLSTEGQKNRIAQTEPGIIYSVRLIKRKDLLVFAIGDSSKLNYKTINSFPMKNSIKHLIFTAQGGSFEISGLQLIGRQ